jgi:hypothetical protein
MITVQNINSAECLATSRVIINDNFTFLQDTYSRVKNVASIAQHNVSNVIEKNINFVNELQELIPSSFNDIYISLSKTNSNINCMSNSIYIHPYNGTFIYLFSAKYNTWLCRDIYKDFKPLEFTLQDRFNVKLKKETNYDIYLSWNDNNNKFEIDFIEWSDSNVGTNLNYTYNYTLGVPTLKTDKTKRYIGCIRTTLEGTTEQNYGGTDIDGVHPKVFLYNHSNRRKHIISNTITGTYTPSRLFTANRDLNDSWFRTSHSNETQMNNSKFSFILGEPTYVEMRYCNTFYSENLATVFSSIGLNTTNTISKYLNTNCIKGVKTCKGTGSTFSTFTGVLQRGFYFLQTFDAATNNVTFNKNFDETQKTGFISVIES